MSHSVKNGRHGQNCKRYDSEGRRERAKQSNVEREVRRAERKIKQVSRREAADKISATDAEKQKTRLEQHVQGLNTRLEQGFVARPGRK